MKVKRVCLLLDEPKIMKWAALAIEKAVKREGISIPLTIINKNNISEIRLPFQKIIIQKVIQSLRKMMGWHIELTDKLPISQLNYLKNSRIYYSLTEKAGEYGTALPRKTIEKIKAQKIDLIFRRGFGILKGDILKCTPFGVLSYHMGNIRKYRGFSSTLEAYLSNEKYINIAVQKLNDELDKGNLFFEERVDITQARSYSEAIKLIYDHLIDTFALSIEKINSPGFRLIKPSRTGRHYGIPGIKEFLILCIRYSFTEIKRKFISQKSKKVRKCFICSLQKVRTRKKKVILKDKYVEIVKCPTCGMLYNNSLDFVESEVEDIYSDEDYGHYKLKDIKEREKNRAILKKYKIDFIKKFIPDISGKKFLDIGCSTGDLLQLAYEEGFKVFGVEISQNACTIARKKGFPLKIYKGEINEAGYSDDYFDVINIDAVMVSVKYPNTFMKEVRRILKPNGYLFIGDNESSHLLLENLIYKLLFREIKDYKYWLNFFTIKTFKKFMEKQHFKLIHLESLCYSDKVIQAFTPQMIKNKCLIKIAFFILRITKIDRMLGYFRLFEAVLAK